MGLDTETTVHATVPSEDYLNYERDSMSVNITSCYSKKCMLPFSPSNRKYTSEKSFKKNVYHSI